MHIIVTGARGFVGRGLMPLLAARGHTGVATGRAAPADLPPGWTGATRDRVLSGAGDAVHADAIIHLEVKQHAPRPTPADIDDFVRQIRAGKPCLVGAGTTRKSIVSRANLGRGARVCSRRGAAGG
jgi:nucleoside-diphosphate-sugar epimerase